MASSNFAFFFKRVLEDEGTGYEDVEGDNGGPTKCGITIADVARFNGVRCPARGGPGWDALVAKVRALDPAKAGVIYKRYYWDTVRADDLPSGLDYSVVDYAVNSGTGRAIPVLRRLLGLPPGTADDAMVEAAGKVDTADLINRLQDERKAFLEHISQAPHNAKFRKGWLAREARVRNVALNLVGKSPADAIAQSHPKAIGDHPRDAELGVGAIVIPAADPPKAGVISTAYGSRTIWAQLTTIATLVLGVITDWAKEGWNFLMTLIGIAPDVYGDAKESLTNAQEMAGWFGANWTKISVSVALACIAVAIVRHLNDKRKLAESN